MDINEFLPVFIEESKEHLQNCYEQLLKLEKHPDNKVIINEIFRSAHTLKSMSATMGFSELTRINLDCTKQAIKRTVRVNIDRIDSLMKREEQSQKVLMDISS